MQLMYPFGWHEPATVEHYPTSGGEGCTWTFGQFPNGRSAYASRNALTYWAWEVVEVHPVDGIHAAVSCDADHEVREALEAIYLRPALPQPHTWRPPPIKEANPELLKLLHEEEPTMEPIASTYLLCTHTNGEAGFEPEMFYSAASARKHAERLIRSFAAYRSAKIEVIQVSNTLDARHVDTIDYRDVNREPIA